MVVSDGGCSTAACVCGGVGGGSSDLGRGGDGRDGRGWVAWLSRLGGVFKKKQWCGESVVSHFVLQAGVTDYNAKARTHLMSIMLTVVTSKTA